MNVVGPASELEPEVVRPVRCSGLLSKWASGVVGCSSPAVSATDSTVTAILEQRAANESWDTILRGYAELERADIQPALDYARHTESRQATSDCFARRRELSLA